MRTLTRESVIYKFSPENPPIFSVEPGETFCVQTDDCFRSQIQTETDLVTDVDFSRINPATGPIDLKGIQPGDILAVDILDIEVGKQGVMVGIPEEGAFGDRITDAVTKVIPISDGKFFFTDEIAFPIQPMIGVIGVSPSDGEVPSGEIGEHGGNLDAKVMKKGARVYFLARTEGAMFALGDAHAGMGDGESVICGVETIANVTLKLDLIHPQGFAPQRPVVEVDDKFVTIAHGSTLDEAAAKALGDMADLIRYKTKMNDPEIGMLISAVGDLKVCQIVDPQKTARVEMPKSALGLLADSPILP
ncbi:acetamidase [candidate division KSB3 bacterium]|uniref:Acetamidase n=1 Tax=candidate division KSB3 bacterium TaxID=2044937 RepID=A0A2G6KI28_9BACT|nr:MAG: acetamidase [candidate division KSB3 bacterium]